MNPSGFPQGSPGSPRPPRLPPPGPGRPLRAALMGSGLLSPWCGSAAPPRYSQPGGLQQPLSHGPGGSPVPEWSCSPSLTVAGVLPIWSAPTAPEPRARGLLQPSPRGLEDLLPPKGPVAPHQQFWSPSRAGGDPAPLNGSLPGHRATPGFEPAASPPRRRARVPSPQRRDRSLRPPKPRGTPAQPRVLGACP